MKREYWVHRPGLRDSYLIGDTLNANWRANMSHGDSIWSRDLDPVTGFYEWNLYADTSLVAGGIAVREWSTDTAKPVLIASTLFDC